MSQIKKKFIADNAIDGTKIQLLNEQKMRAVGSDGVDRDLFYFSNANEFRFAALPKISLTPVADDDVVRKAYVDSLKAAEQSAREAADADLQIAIDAEESRATAAEATLQAAIDALETYTNQELAAEASAREAADGVLQGKIDAEKARIDAILLASDADKDSFAEIVALINSVDTANDSAFASYVLSNNAALAQEVNDRIASVYAESVARQTADTTLQSNIDAEVSARQAGDLAEASARQAGDLAEASARQAADTTLQSNIDAEASARQAGDLAEQSARQAADTTLQGNIDAEASARQAADTTLQSNIDAETSARMAADTAEASARAAADAAEASARAAADAAEASARQAADAQEAAIREAADSVLQSNITAEAAARLAADTAETAARVAADTAETAARVAADAIEASARQAADVLLQNNIDAETNARQAADGVLLGKIDVEKARIDAILSASDADKDSFAEIVALINSVDSTNDSAFASYVLSNNAALAQEVSDRQAGDASLQAQIDALDSGSSVSLAAVEGRLNVLEGAATVEGSVAKAEQDAKDYADAAVATEAAARLAADTAEASARQAADTTLQSNIDAETSARQAADTAEASARMAADGVLQNNFNIEVSARQAADTAEASARQAADTTLQSNIDAEASARLAADTAEASARAAELPRFAKFAKTLTSTDVGSSGYVDLAHAVIPESLNVFVDRLVFHVGDDYTLSTISGVTRITFTSPLMSSEEAPAPGDLMRCTYAYKNQDQ